MDERAITCCFSGHRPNKLPWGFDESDTRCQSMVAELTARLDGIYESGYRHFLCGMAIGCDLLFAEAVLALREEHSDVTLEAAIPCLSQPNAWPKAQQQRYEHLLSECDSVSFLQHQYTPGCMLRRNRYMVDHASLLLCCFNGQSGGTMNTILYARRSGVDVVIIDI